MIGTTPPYALDTTPFRFPAIASCAGRAPLGGDRDLALGVYTVARLAQALLPPIELDGSMVAVRTDRAKIWLSGLTMPQPARMALIRALDATVTGPGNTASAIAELAQIVTGHIDAPAQYELSDLVSALRLYYEHHAERVSHGRP